MECEDFFSNNENVPETRFEENLECNDQFMCEDIPEINDNLFVENSNVSFNFLKTFVEKWSSSLFL